MAAKLGFNPFYPVLVAAGLLFAFTACCYGVLMVNMLQPDRAAVIHEQQTGLLVWLDRHGMWVMTLEIGALALLTFAAIGSDSYWTREGKPADHSSDPVS